MSGSSAWTSVKRFEARLRLGSKLDPSEPAFLEAQYAAKFVRAEFVDPFRNLRIHARYVVLIPGVLQIRFAATLENFEEGEAALHDIVSAAQGIGLSDWR